MEKIHGGNSIEAREKITKIIKKRTLLRRELKDNMPRREQRVLAKKIKKLSEDMDHIQRERIKQQTALENSGRWIDGIM